MFISTRFAAQCFSLAVSLKLVVLFDGVPPALVLSECKTACIFFLRRDFINMLLLNMPTAILLYVLASVS